MSRRPSLGQELDAALELMLGIAERRSPVDGSSPLPIALGWATVDLDRAAGDLVRRLPVGGVFDPVPDDALLGARCLVGPPIETIDVGGRRAGSLRIVLMEPSTEGRLAATLARHGEGPAAVWVDGVDPPEPPVSRAADGPFGSERLLLGGPVDGPHVLVVAGRTGTIEV